MDKKGIFVRALSVLFMHIIVCFPEISMAKTAKIDGVKLYNKHCDACHDKNGKPTDFGKELETTDFTDGNWQASVTDEKIIKQINGGTAEKMMPFQDKLSSDEIKALVPVIRSFSKK